MKSVLIKKIKKKFSFLMCEETLNKMNKISMTSSKPTKLELGMITDYYS